MHLKRPVSALALLTVLALASWLWWNRPHPVDMTSYAPADSLIYLESDSLVKVAEALSNSGAWSELGLPKSQSNDSMSRWLYCFSKWTGIGKTEQVILGRGQAAIAVFSLGTNESGDTLKIKPEIAIIIETHTSAARTRSTVERLIGQFAEKSFGNFNFRRTTIDEDELMEWSALAEDRKIVASILGTLVIVGNTENAVLKCANVRKGRQSSLQNDSELKQMRAHLNADHPLAFGYISGPHVARLFASIAPLFLGKPSSGLSDNQFEQLLERLPSKILGGVGWSAHSIQGGIEDRYLFALQAPDAFRLEHLTKVSADANEVLRLLPPDTTTLTLYRYADPSGAWANLRSGVSSRLDTLSAVVFNALLKSSLQPYGIDDPDLFLRGVGPGLATARLAPSATRSVLVGRVVNRKVLSEMLSRDFGPSRVVNVGERQLSIYDQKQSALCFIDDYLILGLPTDITRCIEAAKNGGLLQDATRMNQLGRFASLASGAQVLTYSNETARVRSLITLLAPDAMRNSAARPEIERRLGALPYATTETTLGELGIERRTRSSFGQFSSVIPLLFPERPQK